MRIALIDHYDSFTFNVIDWLKGGDPAVEVDYCAADDYAGLERLKINGLPLVLSPGPKRPEDAPQTLALIRDLLGLTPILGICLGHQMLAYLAGAAIQSATHPEHGTTRLVNLTPAAGPLFKGMNPSFRVATYNSLAASPNFADKSWKVSAFCQYGDVQAIARDRPREAGAYGVQFHPESFMSEHAAILCQNWLSILAAWRARP